MTSAFVLRDMLLLLEYHYPGKVCWFRTEYPKIYRKKS